MKQILTNSQRNFLSELFDLVINNYIIRVQSYGDNGWFVKLKHMKNGRTLILWCNDKKGYIKEGKKFIKQWPLPSNDN